MVIGDARTQTFATSQTPPDAPRPKLIGMLMGPIVWGDTTWAALTWDMVSNQPPRFRREMFLHESFHIVQMRLGLLVSTLSAEPLDVVEGRYWVRLSRGALRHALRGVGRGRAAALRKGAGCPQDPAARRPRQIR